MVGIAALAVCASLLAMPKPGVSAARQATVDLPIVLFGALPREAHDTLRLIRQGGPFPYARDGVEFGNFERLLPRQPRNYYREYTVKTPGVKHRGARRIVCGVVPECYYSADHYQTFKRIREQP